MTRTIILRTPEQKADLGWNWARPDYEFFAAGACHVLAAAFLLEYPEARFQAWRVEPDVGQRGAHVVVASDEWVFDWAGYEKRNAFVSGYCGALRALFPSWQARFVKLELDPIGWDCCRRHQHRHPSQFLHDPMPRARAYVRRFPPSALDQTG